MVNYDKQQTNKQSQGNNMSVILWISINTNEHSLKNNNIEKKKSTI